MRYSVLCFHGGNGGKFRHTERFLGCGAVARLCRFFAVLGLKPPEHDVVCGVFLLGVGLYLTSHFLIQNP